MARDDVNDFRYAAAAESVRILRAARVSNALNSEGSVCVPVEGDATGRLYQMAVIPALHMLVGLLLILFGVVYLILIVTPWVDGTLKTFLIGGGAALAGVVVCVFSDGVVRGMFDATVVARQGSAFVRDVESRVSETYRFAVEDPATYGKQKVISEDYAVGGTDRSGRGLLLAGVQYQYVIRPGDVAEIREDGRHVLISTRVGAAVLAAAVCPMTGTAEGNRRARGEILAGLGARVGEVAGA